MKFESVFEGIFVYVPVGGIVSFLLLLIGAVVMNILRFGLLNILSVVGISLFVIVLFYVVGYTTFEIVERFNLF